MIEAFEIVKEQNEEQNKEQYLCIAHCIRDIYVVKCETFEEAVIAALRQLKSDFDKNIDMDDLSEDDASVINTIIDVVNGETSIQTLSELLEELNFETNSENNFGIELDALTCQVWSNLDDSAEYDALVYKVEV